MNKICYGCGVKLQTENKDKNGYIPESKKADAKYCMRCFRMMHYGENKVMNTPKDVKEIINKINKDVRYVIFLVDFLNINKEVVKIFKSIKKRKVLIVNKCELLPKHIKKERLIEYLSEYYDIKDPIKLKGGTVNHGAQSVLNFLDNEDIREAYILGISNSGKSTLINDLAKICGAKVSKINVSNTSNTTLDFIRVNLTSDLTLIDSPGFIIDNYIETDVSSKNVVAYSMNMKECETVGLLDNQYFLKFDAPTSLTFYTNSVSKKAIKKYFKAADGLVNKIKIEKENTDVVIYGIGFITIKKTVTITTTIDKKHIEIRSSMFGGDYEQD